MLNIKRASDVVTAYERRAVLRATVSRDEFIRLVNERLEDIGDCDDAEGIALEWTLRDYQIDYQVESIAIAA